MSILNFPLGVLTGLSIGIGLWGWERNRLKFKLRPLFQAVNPAWKSNSHSVRSLSQVASTIAAQLKATENLEQQLESYRQALYTAPVGFLQVDDDNRLIWANQQASALLEIPQIDYPKPRLLLEIVRSYELDHLIELTRNAGKPCQYEWIFSPVSPDPTKLSNQSSYTLRGYGLPMLNGQIGIFLENRQEAINLVQQRDRWASDVAHELKTPLTSIRLVAETLQLRLDPSLRNWVDRLINETVRLSNLVQDLLDLGQIEQGSFNCLQITTVDLAALVHAAWAGVEPLARTKQVELDYNGPEHCLVQVDEPRIYRVLINLLDNSIKYSPPQNEIQVRLGITVDAKNEQVCLEVIDAGIGFSEADLPHIFERFYRADRSRSRGHSVERSAMQSSGAVTTTAQPSASRQNQVDLYPQSGSGLGLAIVHQIVEAHSGKVIAANHPHTGGAWLRVYLPLCQNL